MRTLATGLAIVLAAGAAGPARAQYDGSAAMLCAPATVLECVDSGECARRSAREVNVPAFVTVDVAKRTIAAVGEPARTAPIERLERADGQLVLQGAQNGRAWSFMVAEKTGQITVSVAGSDFAFVIFGACTIVPGGK
ncbi:MAG TPA: hypothetical protein VFN71_15780 [Methylomirabilota bacterium]|nr:hypothetical protein [Methylomirabilota bacterium]